MYFMYGLMSIISMIYISELASYFRYFFHKYHEIKFTFGEYGMFVFQICRVYQNGQTDSMICQTQKENYSRSTSLFI